VDTFHEMGRFHRASRYPNSPKLASITAAFRKWISYINGSYQIDSDFAGTSTDAIPMASSLIYSYGRRVANSVPMQSGQSLLFLVPGSSKPGDVVAIFMGLPLPFILRPAGPSDVNSKQRVFRIIGSAYAHGLMDGQVYESTLSEEQIVLE
jgi:hypothetical protein